MAVISLEGMKFYAYHGYYPEERIIGGEYLVDVHISTNTRQAAVEDELAATINYETVYLIVEAEMRKSSKLLEQVILRIILGLKYQFSNMSDLEVKVTKLNPPMEGEVASSSLSEAESFASRCGRCSKGNICYGDETCWCNTKELYSKTQENVKEQFGGKCLCKNCLGFFGAN